MINFINADDLQYLARILRGQLCNFCSYGLILRPVYRNLTNCYEAEDLLPSG